MQTLALTTLTLIAATIGTLTGFGSSTVMIPFVVLIFPLPVALLFVGIIHTFNDIWKIILFKRGINLPLLLAFGIPGSIFSIIGAQIVLTTPAETLARFLGLILIIYVAYIFINPKFRLPHNLISAGSGGALSGFLAGLFGIGGPVRSMFLTAFNFKKEVYLFTSGAIALLIDLPRLAAYLAGGTRLPSTLAWGLLIFIPVSFVGAKIAEKLIHKIPQNTFRKTVAVFLFLIALKLLLAP